MMLLANQTRLWLQKQLWLLALVGLSLPLTVLALDEDLGNDDLGGMENSFFHRVYALEDTPDRLSRLESLIFGEAQVGDFTQRMTKLLSTASANKINIDPVPLEEIEGALEATQPPEDDISNEPDASDYPTVTEMEQKVLKQAFVQDPINVRLRRLEDIVLKQNFEQLPLVNRVDQLIAKVLPNRGYGAPDEVLPQIGGKPFPKLPPMQVGSPVQTADPVHSALASHMNAVEIQVFGRNYFGENLTTRVARLEAELFNRPQHGNFEDRFDRILANYQSALQAKRQGQPFTPSDTPMQMPQPPQFVPPTGFNGDQVGVFNVPTGDAIEFNPIKPYVAPSNAPRLQTNYQPPFNQPVQPFQMQGYGVTPTQQAQPPQPNFTQQWPDQITLMEQAVFGKNFQGLQMQDRVANLEVKVFGYGNNLQPLAQRIQQLDVKLRRR